MSQIFKDGATGPVPPSVPQQFTADDATIAIPVANNLNVFSQDTIDNNDNGIQTTVIANGSANFYIELTNRLKGTGSATDSGVANLITFDLGASVAVYRFEFKVAGRDTVTGDGVGYTIDASAKTDGAASTIIKTPFIDADEDNSLVGALIDVIASGNNIIVQATGVAVQTITYNAVGTYTVV